MKVLPRVFFILLLTAFLFAPNSFRCRGKGIFSGDYLREKYLGCPSAGVKSLILWKRLIKQSMTVDSSAPKERLTPPLPKQLTTMYGLYRTILEISCEKLSYQLQTTLLQMEWQSLQNKKFAYFNLAGLERPA